MRQVFARLKTPSLVIGILGAAAVLFYQSLGWLRTGTWVPFPLDTVAHSVRSIGSAWTGLQIAFDWILSFPLSISVFLVGLILFGCFNALSPREENWAPSEPPAPSPLLELSKLDHKDRIQILMSEYAGLRAEINSRTGYGFQITAIAAAAATWLLQQTYTDWRPWLGLVLILGALKIMWSVNGRDIWRAARRIRELEREINSRAGEHLLVWETLWGAARTTLFKSFFSKLEPSPYSELPPLDPSYLQRRTPEPGDS